MTMKKKISCVILMVSLSSLCFAEPTHTGRGKIIQTQGHVAESCRTVGYKSNSTNEIQYFRIQAGSGSEDIQTIILAALIANRDVSIYYDSNVTSGCGPESRITYVTVY